MPQPRRLAAVVALSFGSAMAVMNTSIAYVALPTIAGDLGVPEALTILVITIYQLTLVMTMLSFAVVDDRIGHRRLYLLGQMLF